MWTGALTMWTGGLTCIHNVDWWPHLHSQCGLVPSPVFTMWTGALTMWTGALTMWTGALTCIHNVDI